jgi:hypothetical protein
MYLHKVCVKLGKSAAETLEMPLEAFGEHSLSQTVVFECHSRLKACRQTFRVTKYQQNDRKCLKTFKNSSTKAVAEKRKCVMKKTGTLTQPQLAPSVVIVPHPPFLRGLAPCDFTSFSKLKLKGWGFETVSDIQRESQTVLDSVKDNDFHRAF